MTMITFNEYLLGIENDTWDYDELAIIQKYVKERYNATCTKVEDVYEFICSNGHTFKLNKSQLMKECWCDKCKFGDLKIIDACIKNDRPVSLTYKKTKCYKEHWKTGYLFECNKEYESDVIDYLNKNKIDYKWKVYVFQCPLTKISGKAASFRPELFLPDQNKWIKIGAFISETDRLKWQWFQSTHPNSEHWDYKMLFSLGIILT